MPPFALKARATAMFAAPPSSGTQPASAPRADTRAHGHAWRGLLIVLIVLGHNHLFASTFPALYRLIYDFHVEAFLIIPFLRAPDPGRRAVLLYPLRTYYRPFCVFVTTYAALFALSGIAEAPASFGDAVLRWACALTIANSDVLNWATGFEMFWFLPVFILLSTLRPLIERGSRTVLAAALVGAAALHLSAGYLGSGAVAWLPWGLPVVGYVLFPCLIAAALARSGLSGRVPVWVAAGAFAAALVVCAAGGFWVNLSDFKVYDARSLAGLLATDACMVAASLFFYRIDGVLRAGAIDAIGRYSLQIYLIHGVIGYLLVRVAGKHHGLAVTLALLAITYAVTLALSYVAARALMASRVGAWIFSTKPAGRR